MDFVCLQIVFLFQVMLFRLCFLMLMLIFPMLLIVFHLFLWLKKAKKTVEEMVIVSSKCTKIVAEETIVL